MCRLVVVHAECMMIASRLEPQPLVRTATRENNPASMVAEQRLLQEVLLALQRCRCFTGCCSRRQRRDPATTVERWEKLVHRINRVRRLRRIWAVLGHRLRELKGK